MTDNMKQTEEIERKVNNEPQMEQNGEADRANEQKEQLLARIQAYHRHINQCTDEMTDCETRIAEHRALLKSKQAMIKKEKRAVFIILRQLGMCELERANKSQAQAKQ